MEPASEPSVEFTNHTDNVTLNITTLYNESTDTWYITVNASCNASAYQISTDEMVMFTLLTLFGLFFAWGYTSNKPSGGFLLVISGFYLLSIALIMTSIYSLMGIPSIYILFMGFKKWLYFDEKSTKRKEQRPS